MQHIIVLGHMRCGGIAALMRRTMSPGRETTSDFIDAWMEIGAPARGTNEDPDMAEPRLMTPLVLRPRRLASTLA